MSNVENVRNLENIFFVKKGIVIEKPDSPFVKAIKTIDNLNKFKFCIELDTTRLNPNKIVIVEYEKIEDVEEIIFNSDNPNISLYLKNMAIILDGEASISTLPRSFDSIKKFRLDDLEEHFNKIFDIYTKVLVLADDIAKKITGQIREIITSSLADEEETYVSIEQIAYLQELRYYLIELSLSDDNISCSSDIEDLVASYLVDVAIKGIDEDEISNTIIEKYESFEFYDSTWGDINEDVKDVLVHLNKK